MSPNIYAFLNEHRPRCTNNQLGAVVAFIVLAEPHSTVPSDYGGIVLLILGMGECGMPSSTTKRYINEPGPNATDAILKLQGDKK
jgi:hypothetical protein